MSSSIRDSETVTNESEKCFLVIKTYQNLTDLVQGKILTTPLSSKMADHPLGEDLPQIPQYSVLLSF